MIAVEHGFYLFHSNFSTLFQTLHVFFCLCRKILEKMYLVLVVALVTSFANGFPIIESDDDTLSSDDDTDSSSLSLGDGVTLHWMLDEDTINMRVFLPYDLTWLTVGFYDPKSSEVNRELVLMYVKKTSLRDKVIVTVSLSSKPENYAPIILCHSDFSLLIQTLIID